MAPLRFPLSFISLTRRGPPSRFYFLLDHVLWFLPTPAPFWSVAPELSRLFELRLDPDSGAGLFLFTFVRGRLSRHLSSLFSGSSLHWCPFTNLLSFPCVCVMFFIFTYPFLLFLTFLRDVVDTLFFSGTCRSNSDDASYLRTLSVPFPFFLATFVVVLRFFF